MGQMDTLKDLYEAYRTDDRLEDLRIKNINFVPGTGPLNPDIMLIGEMPGRLEDKRKRPFVGQAGINLDNLLKDSNIEPNDTFMTNVLKYWPKGKELTEEELAVSREYLKHEIEIVDPLLVGLCGLAAIHAIYPGKDAVFEDNGNLLDGRFIPLYHPAVYTHNPNKAPHIKRGYAKLYAHLVSAQSINSER